MKLNENWLALFVAIVTENNVKKSLELIRHGGHIKTFTKKEKAEILKLRHEGKRIVDIAKEYKVTRQQIGDLIRHNSKEVQG